jgi:site-specific recombinase XerD
MIDELLDEFLRHLVDERHLSPKTGRFYQVDLKHFQRFLENKVLPLDTEGQSEERPIKNLLEITTDDVQQFIDYIAGRGYKPRSVNRKLAAIGSFCRFAVKSGKLTSSPIHHEAKRGGGLNIKRVPLPKKELNYISPEETEQLIAAIEPDSNLRRLRDKALYSLMVRAGLRAPELQTLTLGAVDLVKRQLAITRRREISIPLEGRLLAVVEAYYFARLDSVEGLTDNDLLFVNKHGQSISTRSIRRNLDKYAKKAGLKVNPSQLRHSFAIHEVRKGVNVQQLQERLGHISHTTTKAYLDYKDAPRDNDLGPAAPIEEVEPVAEVTTCGYMG